MGFIPFIKSFVMGRPQPTPPQEKKPEETPPLSCDVCGFTGKTATSLKIHKTRKHT